MRYIRTKDGVYRLYYNSEFERYEVECDAFLNRIRGQFIISEAEIGKYETANTIEELCDGFYIDFVNYKGFDKEKIGENYTFEDFKETFTSFREFEGKGYTHCEGYGFIKTNKGLIYVAKMNDKGELELI